MAEHIRLHNEHKWAEWFLIHAIVEANNGPIKVPSIPEGGSMVTLTINGVECPVIDTLEYLEKQHDDIIQRMVEKYIEEHVGVKMGEIDELFRDFQTAIREKLEAKGLLKPKEY